MGVPIPHNSPASLLRSCWRTFAALALVAAALAGAQAKMPPAERIHKLVAESADLSRLNIGDISFILANAENEDAGKLWAEIKGKTTPVPGIVLEASASTVKIAFVSTTQDAKETGSPVFIVRLKSPLAPTEIPPVGFKFGIYSAGTGIVGAFESYARLDRAGLPNSVQIVLRDGEIQLVKRNSLHPRVDSVPVKKKVSKATKAQHLIPVAEAPAEVLPTAPAEPEEPPFPINDKPTQATVHWDSMGLRIEAANSSLEQILTDVSAATGAKVEGLDADQRVFGAFGPGPARDVLSQLLHGSGYNVVMIGDQGQGTPRKIILSSPHPGGATPAAAPAQESDDDAEAEEQPAQPQAQPNRPGFLNGMPQRMPGRMPPGQQGQSGQPGQPQSPNGPQN
ncbi:MAG: hypothetical protein WB424_15810 [Terracidiphilus sp.]